MEDSKFVRDLKEGATGKRLPTIEDLGPGYVSPFEEEAANRENLQIPVDIRMNDMEEDKPINDRETYI